MLNISKIIHESKIYGPFSRDVIWFQGCSFHCKNCINPEMWSFENNKLISPVDLLGEIKSKHVTLLGGEPLQQKNIGEFISLLKKNDIGIILFTGFNYDELDDNLKTISKLCDVVIYGRYIDELKDDSLYLIGSKNQQIIFNTELYKQDDFSKTNIDEILISDSVESHGRNKNLIVDLFNLNR